jgi:hypothetical protein
MATPVERQVHDLGVRDDVAERPRFGIEQGRCGRHYRALRERADQQFNIDARRLSDLHLDARQPRSSCGAAAIVNVHDFRPLKRARGRSGRVQFVQIWTVAVHNVTNDANLTLGHIRGQMLFADASDVLDRCTRKGRGPMATPGSLAGGDQSSGGRRS